MGMNIGIYRSYLHDLIQDALENSDGTNKGISEYLWSRDVKGLLTRNKKEKQIALNDARKAFDDHRHWPVEIVLTHLSLDPKEFLRE
jgi:hypothetical protein